MELLRRILIVFLLLLCAGLIVSFIFYLSGCGEVIEKLDPNLYLKLIDEDVTTHYQPKYIKRIDYKVLEANLEDKSVIYLVSYLMVDTENELNYFVARVKPCDPDFDINCDGWDVDTERVYFKEN